MFFTARVLTISLLLFPALAFAQDRGKIDSLVATFEKLNSRDTLENPLDSLETKLNRLDSVHQKLETQLDSIKSPRLSKLDSARFATQRKIDSLQALQLPHKKYLKQLDSLQKVPIDVINKQINNMERKAWDGLQQIPSNLEGKTKPIEEVTEKLPHDLPGKIENIDQADLDLSVEGMDMPINTGILSDGMDNEVNLPGDILKSSDEIEIPGALDKVDDISVGEIDIENLKEMDEVEERMDKSSEWTGRGKVYQTEFDSLRAGNTSSLEERLDQQAGKIDEVGKFKEHTTEFDQYKQQQKEFKAKMEEKQQVLNQYADPELVKQRILEKSKRVANDQLARYRDKVKEARQKLSQTKVSGVNKDTLRHNSGKGTHKLKDKSWRYRIRPGFNLEISRAREQTAFDLAPYIGYKMNDHWALYSSYMYRVMWNADKTNFSRGGNVYGPRLITTYEVYKNFFIRLSYEQIRAAVPRSTNSLETMRKWVQSGYAGIGKTYNFSRYIKGNVQVMYNFLYSDNSPYQKKWNIRMGFEFDLKKRKKRKWDIPDFKGMGKKMDIGSSIE